MKNLLLIIFSVFFALSVSFKINSLYQIFNNGQVESEKIVDEFSSGLKKNPEDYSIDQIVSVLKISVNRDAERYIIESLVHIIFILIFLVVLIFFFLVSCKYQKEKPKEL